MIFLGDITYRKVVGKLLRYPLVKFQIFPTSALESRALLLQVQVAEILEFNYT